MKLFEQLSVEKGVTAVIGSGGKTTMIHTLARELSASGTVLITTTTHIRPSEEFPCLYAPSAEEIRSFLRDPSHPAVCAGALNEEGKFGPLGLSFADLKELADYVLVEADGSRGLPLKAHAPHEPVIPDTDCRIICVIGGGGIGKRICEAVHRPELFCRIACAGPGEPASPELTAWVLNAENFADIYYVSQCDLPGVPEQAALLASYLGKPCVCGSLLNGER